MNQSKFTSHDGKQLALYVWDEVTNPVGVVKICHGMAEHGMRYDHFARYLNEHGCIVVCNDHRGHGNTAQEGKLGYEEGDMFENNVKDQIVIVEHLAEKYGLPVVLFGHSYGSFVTQSVMQRNNRADAYVLCGSNYIKGAAYSLCGMIARRMCKRKGGDFPANTIVNLSFKQYERRFRGKNNWLSANPDNVKRYNNDKMCGFVCSANFYATFMAGVKHLYDHSHYVNTDTNKPLLIISGKDDPVGEYGKGVKKLVKFYEHKVGIKNLQWRLLEKQRHEILNETDNLALYQYVNEWLDKVTAQK